MVTSLKGQLAGPHDWKSERFPNLIGVIGSQLPGYHQHFGMSVMPAMISGGFNDCCRYLEKDLMCRHHGFEAPILTFNNLSLTC